jgi:hypothetical protein
MTIRETVDGSPPELRPEDPILVVDDIAGNRELRERRLELRG